MGCSSSKRIEAATVDVYCLALTSFVVFDIYAIEEPWLRGNHASEQQQEKAMHVPPCLWDEVSRVLEDLKPTLHSPAPVVFGVNPFGLV